MSENKFLAKMRGEKAPKSLVEVKNDKFSTPFVDLPKSTSVTDGFDNEAEHSIVVAKSAQNWALQKSGIKLLADDESADYTGQVSIAGHGMWVNSSYTFPLSEEPANPVVAIINPCAKWVLNFVGKDLFSQNDTIGFTLVVKVGATHISNIDCEVKRQAGFFCKKFVIDFSESEQELIKVNGGDTLTVQLVCNDDTASAVYYTGSSVLSLLQRKVDGDVVAGNTKTFGDLVEDVYDIREEIKNKFLGVYRFKGTVPTYMDLPADNNVVGDTYNISDTGSNYTWDGTAWDKLSETVDLSPYLTKAEAEATYLPKATVLDYDNITNCITEIPQDIKLDLTGGTLTLKAGSIVYVPNGAGVFNKRTATKNVTTQNLSSYPNGQYLVFDNGDFSGTSLRCNLISACYSGTTAPATGAVWYDTTNNKIMVGSGSTWSGNRTLPLGVITISNGTISSIDQVFNGFGYIGSTMFTLPGVKGLIPNGRNEDGTLKNTTINCTSVQTVTLTAAYSATLVTYNNGRLGAWGDIQYDPVKNITYNNSTPKANVAMIGKCAFGEGGRVTLFEPNQPFHAVDYSDFETLSDTVETNNDNAVHKTGNETIGGVKTFTGYIKASAGVGVQIEATSHSFNLRSSGAIPEGCGLFVDNDASKMVFNATDTKITIGSSNIVPYSVTPPSSDNSTRIATTAWSNAKFLPLAGGTMSGAITRSGTQLAKRNVDNSYLELDGGTTYLNGAYLRLDGKDSSGTPGQFRLATGDGSANKQLIGKPDGSLMWDGVYVATTKAKSLASNGYVKFNNGLIIQWGRTGESTGGARTITFPTAFTTKNYQVCPIPLVAGQTISFYAIALSDTEKTTTTAVIRGNADVSKTGWSWIAIGY